MIKLQNLINKPCLKSSIFKSLHSVNTEEIKRTTLGRSFQSWQGHDEEGSIAGFPLTFL